MYICVCVCVFQMDTADNDIDRLIEESINSFTQSVHAFAAQFRSPRSVMMRVMLDVFSSVESYGAESSAVVEDSSDDDDGDEQEPQEPQQQPERQTEQRPERVLPSWMVRSRPEEREAAMRRRVCLQQPCCHRPTLLTTQSPELFDETSDVDSEVQEEEEEEEEDQPSQQQVSQPGSSRGLVLPRVPLSEVNPNNPPLRITEVRSIPPHEFQEGRDHHMSSSEHEDEEDEISTPCNRPLIMHHCSSRKRRLFSSRSHRHDDTSNLAEPLPSTSSAQPTMSSLLHEVIIIILWVAMYVN